MKLESNSYVVIADSGKYLFLRNQGDADILDLRVVEHGVRDNPPTHEQGSDKPGRFPTSAKQYSAVTESDWHRLEKQHAGRDLANRINDLSEQLGLNSIVLVADPATLGRVRPLLSDRARSCVRTEIAKDLTHHPSPDIERILSVHRDR